MHHDLEPSNVVLGADGRARVLDFGIARLIGASDALEDPGSVADTPEALEMLGTPAYMAPDQWNREDHAPADVWALGLLVCEVFLGTQPLLRRGTPEIVAELMRDTRLPMPPFRSPSELAAWMRASPERMALVLTELASGSSETLIFVVDRLEALVAESGHDDVRAFSAALFALALSNDERVRVVATVDEGALGRLPTTLFATARVMRLEPPDVEELRAIALETLAAAGARVADPDAFDEVMELLAGDACALVLLRFVLLDTWRSRDPDQRRRARRRWDACGGRWR